MIYNKSYGDIVKNYLGIPLHTKVKIIGVTDDRGQVWNKKNVCRNYKWTSY